MTEIHFFKEDCEIDLRKLKNHKSWLVHLAKQYNYHIQELNYIFCSDEYLHKINLEYLNHDTYTDIITFDLQEKASKDRTIESDIFISVDRVQENADKLNTDMLEELKRVMAHGLLHLIGFKDKTVTEKEEMRLAENKALELL